jgi:hypothetical protein
MSGPLHEPAPSRRLLLRRIAMTRRRPYPPRRPRARRRPRRFRSRNMSEDGPPAGIRPISSGGRRASTHQNRRAPASPSPPNSPPLLRPGVAHAAGRATVRAGDTGAEGEPGYGRNSLSVRSCISPAASGARFLDWVRGPCVAMTWEAKARARHRLESSLSESRDSDGDGVSPVVDGSGPV